MYLYLNSVNISRANKLINKALRILYFFLTMKGWYTNPNQFLLDWDIGLVVFGADCHETMGKKYNIVSSKVICYMISYYDNNDI
jgi:hypothetical protein